VRTALKQELRKAKAIKNPADRKGKLSFLDMKVGALESAADEVISAQNALLAVTTLNTKLRILPGSALGIDHMRVARVWVKAGFQPHRRRHYMVSDDPQFEKKAAAIIGLYLKSPAHTAVFSVDEKSAIQALDRLDPVLPLSPGRAERHGFEYFRHGTLSLYAALNTATGQVLGKTANRHTSAQFVEFLADATQPAKTTFISSPTTFRLIKLQPSKAF
jgi:hypothetical protein